MIIQQDFPLSKRNASSARLRTYKFMIELVMQALKQRRMLGVNLVLAMGLLQVATVGLIVAGDGLLRVLVGRYQLGSNIGQQFSLHSKMPEFLQPYFPFQNGLSVDSEMLVWMLPMVLVALGLVRSCANFLYNFTQEEVSQRIGMLYREKMFSAVVKVPYLETLTRSPGAWMSSIMADSNFLQSKFCALMTGFVKDGVIVAGGVFYIFALNIKAGFLLIFIILLVGWLLGRTGKKISVYTTFFLKELGTLSAIVLGIRSRFHFMKAQQGESFEKSLFEQSNVKYLNTMKSSIFIRALITPIMEWGGFVLFAFILLLFSIDSGIAELSQGLLAIFALTIASLLTPIRHMGEQVASLGETFGGVRNCSEMFYAISERNSEPGVDKTQMMNAVSQIHRTINIEKLAICYRDKDVVSIQKAVLSRGRSIAIVGKSGSGKSSLLKSFAGIIEPKVWESNIGWKDFVNLGSYVSQVPFLFSGTIRENLQYGSGAISLNEEDIWIAMRIVKLDQLIGKLPLRLDSELSALNSIFSGGELQRLVIVRALLRSKPMLLLDEATSALDGSMDKHLTQLLTSTCRDQDTYLVAVTHRTSCLEYFDDVWFLDEGQILLRGRHVDLLSDSKYSDFCQVGTMA